MKINPLIFRAYDIRGIAIAPPLSGAVADLTTETVKAIGQGTGTYMKRVYGTRNLMVGRDNRLHSEELQKAFMEGVLSTGVDVTDVGLSTSPLLYYSVCKHEFDGGVNITASHNSKEYNGVKIVGKNAHSVCGEELQKILALIQNEDFEKGNGELTTKEDNFEVYLEDMKNRFKLTRPLKVVVDAGNGTAGKFAPELLRTIGCEVIEIYCDLDGNYPNHEANPEEEKNMRDLGRLVVEKKADLGIGFDGDGDRVGVVDENGKHYSADWLLLLLARELLAVQPGAQIVFDVKVSKILIDEITRLGGEPVMSKTGHSFIEGKMHELDAPLAGEISGHLFFGRKTYDYYGFDDAFFGACKILETLSTYDKPFSAHFQNLPVMFTTPEFKAGCPDDRKFQIVDELTKHFTRSHKCITLDGVRVNFDDSSWGAVRCSNTSPNLTLRFEALTNHRLDEIQKLMVEQLKKYPEVSLSWYKKEPSA
ncbi:MAG TPA: phosphomannomutase/phosphoglucomutase [Candidatus Gracilibacteria bacterium]|nr:phosphomannomutase/phosphoglucomutase [Candidatus Gracilibacteria bacterium]